jgi:hypothetical protein
LNGSFGDSFTALICRRKSATFVAVVPIPMSQNYKVFLRDSVILFEKGMAPNSQVLEREDVISLLSKETPSSSIKFISQDPLKSLNDLLSKVDLIEAAGGIVSDPESNHILLIERFGVWDFPKGKIDAGETPLVASIREVEEECGINGLKINRALGATYHGYLLNGNPFIKRTHWFAMECAGNKTTTAQVEEGITQAVWVEKEKVGQLLQKSYGSIIDLWNNAYQVQ